MKLSVLYEAEARCPYHGPMPTRECSKCGYISKLSTSKTAVEPEVTGCPFKVEDFDWATFSKDLDELGELDLDELKDGYFPQTKLLYSRVPLSFDVVKINEMNMSGKLGGICTDFIDNLQTKIQEIGKGSSWEAEFETTPSGYHGSFESMYLWADLGDLEIDEIESIELDDNGTAILHLALVAVHKTDGWKSDSLV